MADKQKSRSAAEQEFWDKAFIAIAAAMVSKDTLPNAVHLADLAAKAADALLDHRASLRPKGFARSV